MISNLFGKSADETTPSLPRDVKEAVTNCRIAVQEALKSRISRMNIEFPVGTNFGVEKDKKKKRDSSGEPTTMADLDASNRELARLFVDMFQPVGGDRIVVAFNNVDLADDAKKRWEDDSTAQSRVLSMDRSRAAKKTKKKKVKPKGFAAKLAAEIEDDANDDSGPFQLPSDTEVALFVSPTPKELVVIEKICSTAGMGTLVILLNARLSTVEKFSSESAANLFQKEFDPVFCLAAAPQTEAPGCLFYRAHPGNWVLARKPKVGQPKPFLVTQHRPALHECQEAFDQLEVSEVEKTVETAIDNVATWFR
jgi:hypothetical protein